MVAFARPRFARPRRATARALTSARRARREQTFHRRIYRVGESSLCLVHYFEDAHLDKRAAPPRAAAPFGAGPGFAPPPFAPGLPPPSEPLAPMALDGPTSSNEELRLFLSDGELLGACLLYTSPSPRDRG